MKVIILAAGKGSRLNKYTEILPKGLLPLAGKSIVEREIEVLRKVGIKDITIITGFNAEKFDIKGVSYVYDSDWENKETNIVNSLFCAQQSFDGTDDILVAYADTVHEPRIIRQIMDEKYPLSKAIDTDYKDYWTARNGDWKIDSESCTLNSDGSIKEIGEAGVIDPKRLQGRDASLTYISKEMAPKVLGLYIKLHQKYRDNPIIGGKSIRKFNMTDFIQSWINNGWKVMANKIKRGWMEFDTNEDYEHALEWSSSGRIKEFIDLNLTE